MDSPLDLEKIAFTADLELGLENPGLKCEDAYECLTCKDWHSESDEDYFEHMNPYSANMEVVA